MTQQLVLNSVTEKDFQQQIITLARLQGWRYYHTADSRRSPFGFPDLVLVRPPRLIFAELKAERGSLSPGQIEWLDDLGRCPGIEVHQWRPSDWDEIVRTLERVG